MDFLNEHNKQVQITEKLFGNLFGNLFGKKEEPSQEEIPQQEPIQQSSPKREKKTAEFKPNKIYSFDMNKIKALGLGELGKVFFMFKSPEDFKMFQKTLELIKGGYFTNDLNALQKAVKYGEVDGYGPYQYLSSIFSSPGSSIAKILPSQPQYRYGRKVSEAVGDIKFTMPKDSTLRHPSTEVPERYTTLESMRRLEMFVRYFVENIVDETGVPNEVAQNAIINKIKFIIGTNKPQPAKLAPNVKGTVQTEPGTQKQDIVGSEESQETENPEGGVQSRLDMLKKQAQGKSKKDIKKEIRDLLKNNF